MDLDAYLTTAVLDIFVETPGIRNHYVDDNEVVVSVVGADVTVPGTGVGL